MSRPITAAVVNRFCCYDVTRDIYWREVSAKELELIQAAREACGLPPLVFHSHMAAVNAFMDDADLADQEQQLRAFFGMEYDGTEATAFGHVLRRVLRILRGEEVLG